MKDFNSQPYENAEFGTWRAWGSAHLTGCELGSLAPKHQMFSTTLRPTTLRPPTPKANMRRQRVPDGGTGNIPQYCHYHDVYPNDHVLDWFVFLFISKILRHLTESSVTRDQDLMIARYIVQKGLEHVYLRDEIFLQICSQTLENKNVSHLRKTWVLMALCLSCFRPSETLANYLLKLVFLFTIQYNFHL